jgi:hypothetical protein
LALRFVAKEAVLCYPVEPALHHPQSLFDYFLVPLNSSVANIGRSEAGGGATESRRYACHRVHRSKTRDAAGFRERQEPVAAGH